MIALLLALWLGTHQPRTVDVDLLELNTTNVNGCKFEQVICWEWNAEYRRHEVCNWWMADTQFVHRSGYGSYFVDQKGVRVRSSIFIRTHTSIDPERANARLLPSELRVSRL